MDTCVSKKLEHLAVTHNSVIHTTSDLRNDIGLPKGTALNLDAIYPFSMGNEAFDGFLVMSVDSTMTDCELSSSFESAVRKIIIDKKDSNLSKTAIVESIFTRIFEHSNHKSPPAFNLLCSHVKNDSTVKLASILKGRMKEALGTFRPDSSSKFIELCRDDSGTRYFVVHSGVSVMQNTYLYLLQMYGKSSDLFDVKTMRSGDVEVLDIKLNPSSAYASAILFTLDCLRLFAESNREYIAHSIADDMGLADSTETIFHQVHASIERVSENHYLHQNSINRTEEGAALSFVAGPPSYLIEQESSEPHFYPHGLKETSERDFLSNFISNKDCSVRSYNKLTPILNHKDVR
jgi:hypothetical protein